MLNFFMQLSLLISRFLFWLAIEIAKATFTLMAYFAGFVIGLLRQRANRNQTVNPPRQEASQPQRQQAASPPDEPASPQETPEAQPPASTIISIGSRGTSHTDISHRPKDLPPLD